MDIGEIQLVPILITLAFGMLVFIAMLLASRSRR